MLLRTLYFTGLLLLVLSWLLPNHYAPWITFHNESAVFASLIVSLSACIVHRRYFAIGTGWLTPLWLLPLIATHLLAGKIAYFGDAWVSGLYLVGFCAAFWLGRQCAADAHTSESVLATYAGAVIAAALCSFWLSLHQWLGVERLIGFNAMQEVAPGGRPYGNLGQPNHLATLLMMALPLSAVLWMQRRLNNWQFLAVVTLLTWGLAIAGSRASFISGLLLLGFYSWKGRQYWGREGSVALAVWLVGLVICIATVNALNAYLLLAGGGRVFQGVMSDNPRITLWSQFLTAILESPWTGYGWHQSTAAQNVGALRYPADLPTDYAHNALLDLMAWVGVPLAMLIVGVVAIYLYKQILQVQSSYHWLCLASTIPFFFQCLVEFPFAYAYFLLPIAWQLGYANQLSANAELGSTVTPVDDIRSAVAPWAIGAFALALLATWYEYVLAEDDYRVMRFELRNIGKVPVGHVSPHLILLTQLSMLLEYGRWEPHYRMSDTEMDALQQASRSIHWATLQTKLVVALAINGRMDEAEQELRSMEAVFGSPTRLQAHQVISKYAVRFPELRAVPLEK